MRMSGRSLWKGYALALSLVACIAGAYAVPAPAQAAPMGWAAGESFVNSRARTGRIGSNTWTLSNDGTLVVTAGTPSKQGENDTWNWGALERRNVRSVRFEGHVVAPASINGLFRNDFDGYDKHYKTIAKGFANLEVADLTGLDTSQVTDMGNLFYGCQHLSHADLTGLDTSKVTNMGAMFRGCWELPSLDLAGLDTARVTDISHMFEYCSSLASLDVTGWNTSSVTDMSATFHHCESLVALDLSSWSTPRATKAESLFSGCKALTTLDLSSLSTAKMGGEQSMFYGCTSLNSIKVGSSFAIKISDMFPEATSADKTWLSAADNAKYTKKQIVKTRSGVADTYTSGTAPVATTYTVTFYANGGTGTMDRLSVKAGATAKLTANAYTRSGYVFAGWNTEADGTGTAYADKASVSPDDDMALHAQWTRTSSDLSLKQAVIAAIPDQTYTGAALEPEPKVTFAKTTLRKGTDYTVSYKDNVNVGTATVTVTGMGDYIGARSATFEIVEPVKEVTMTLDATSYTYDGTAKKPVATVKAGSQTLVEGTDYTVSYQNNVNAGTATATATLKGAYTGTAKAEFTIAKADQTVKVSDLTLTAGDTATLDAEAKGTLSYASSDTSVASVTADGTVTGEREGTATLTVRAAATNNYRAGSATCTVTVTAPVATYTVTYDANGGTGTMAARVADEGTTVKLSPCSFERVGYDFSGWNTAVDGTGTAYADEASVKVTGDLTLYAQWKEEALTGTGWRDHPLGGKGYVRDGQWVKGWMDLDGRKYWFDGDGRMACGWTDVEVGGKMMHYYFNPASGNLTRNTWMTIDGKNYYFRPSGNMATGFADIEDNGVMKKYYLDEQGQLVTGWKDVVIGGRTMHYYFRPSGSLAIGWATIGGKKYYFRPSGAKQVGEAVIDGHSYVFDENGVLQGGKVQDEGSAAIVMAEEDDDADTDVATPAIEPVEDDALEMMAEPLGDAAIDVVDEGIEEVA